VTPGVTGRPHRVSTSTSSITRWLLDSDPSIRWQVMRDLTDAPEAEIGAERARVATEGEGARLLALQAPDGRWGGAAWNRGWDSTMHVLWLLREMGLDPASDEARRAVGLVRDRVTWRGCGPPEADENPFFAGEVEPCINGQVGAVGAYFGQDVRGIVDRLLAEQLPDGGWNCEAENGSARSSFNTTICVLEALLAHPGERAVAAVVDMDDDLVRCRRMGADALDHEAAASGFDAIGQAAQARATALRRAAAPVVRDLDHEQAIIPPRADRSSRLHGLSGRIDRQGRGSRRRRILRHLSYR